MRQKSAKQCYMDMVSLIVKKQMNHCKQNAERNILHFPASAHGKSWPQLLSMVHQTCAVSPKHFSYTSLPSPMAHIHLLRNSLMEQAHRQTWEKGNRTVPVEMENLCENETWGCTMPQCSKGQEAMKGTGGGLGQKSNDLLPNASCYDFRTTVQFRGAPDPIRIEVQSWPLVLRQALKSTASAPAGRGFREEAVFITMLWKLRLITFTFAGTSEIKAGLE